MVRLTSYKQLFKTFTNSCLRLLQIVPVMLNYFSILLFTFVFGISYRKYSIRTHCVLIYHSCKRLFFSTRYFLRKYFVRSTNSPCLQRKPQLFKTLTLKSLYLSNQKILKKMRAVSLFDT